MSTSRIVEYLATYSQITTVRTRLFYNKTKILLFAEIKENNTLCDNVFVLTKVTYMYKILI